MAKYYLDCEFIEGKQDKKFLGIKYGETPFTIDLISIGIVSEDCCDFKEKGAGHINEKLGKYCCDKHKLPFQNEYYAISKDFNLEEAWNRHDLQLPEEMGDEPIKVYWLRENVLKQIWMDLFEQHGKYTKFDASYAWDEMKDSEKYVYLKMLLLKYGKTNKQIAEEIKEFINQKVNEIETGYKQESIEFYGWYSATDWVLFYSLYGSLMNRPKGFPMRCNDLKQIADEIWEKTGKNTKFESPKNEHNALSDAKWNKELHKFLTNL